MSEHIPPAASALSFFILWAKNKHGKPSLQAESADSLLDGAADRSNSPVGRRNVLTESASRTAAPPLAAAGRTDLAPPTDYDVFDTAEFRHLEAEGALHHYHQSWCYVVRGNDRVFHANAEPFIKPKHLRLNSDVEIKASEEQPDRQDRESVNGSIESRLELLKTLHQKGLISESEFTTKKRDILESL